MFLPGFYFRYSLNKLRANCFFLNSDEEKLMVASASTADISDEASCSVCERLEEYRIVKRYYKCPDNHEF